MSKEDDLVECRRHIDAAISGLDTIHVGPIDYNIATTIDALLVAIRLLERYREEHAR